MFLCIISKYPYCFKIKLSKICYFETALFQGNSKAHINYWICINLDIKSIQSNQTMCGAIVLLMSFPRPINQTWRSVYTVYNLGKSLPDAIAFSKLVHNVLLLGGNFVERG